MSLRLSHGLSFFGGGGSFSYDGKVNTSGTRECSPTLKLQTDKEVYRPGDLITATIEICNLEILKGGYDKENSTVGASSLLVDNLAFEIKGIEKLDTQWFATQKPLPGSKEKRGEHVFLDCTTPSIVSKVIISSGSSKTYLVRAELPKILPPSYRGTTIRYIYYVKSTLCGRWLVLENGHHNRESMNDLIKLEARAPLQIWVMQKNSDFLNDEGQNDRISQSMTEQMDIYWKEKNADSDWARANETLDGLEEGYDSSRDEISSVSSYNPSKGNLDAAFRNSLSLQSMASRPYNSEVQYSQGEPSNFPPFLTLSQLSVAEVLDDTNTGPLATQKKLSPYPSTVLSPGHQGAFSRSPFSKDDTGVPSAAGSVEPVASEGFIRGRSYNIRIDDQVLLRFFPKNSDSTYYYGDMIGGTLTFFHGGARRCLEVSITLETCETITQSFVHPSRRSSPTITKVQSDHHEVVADLLQTSFLFSIPMDGPMSFSTPYISVQWALRFEFFTNPKNVDWTRYDHPLLIEEREKGDWILPITVHAPPPRTQAVHTKNEKSLSLGNLWVYT